jgi:hypothetical protein
MNSFPFANDSLIVQKQVLLVDILYLLHLVRHVVQPQVLGQARSVQGVRVGQQQIGAAVGIPAPAHGTGLQPREVRQQAGRAPVVRGQASPLLALAPGQACCWLPVGAGCCRGLMEAA